MNDLVSIIIPVYNGEKYLEETLISCINQTYSNIEVITVDDGSSDQSSKILKKYSDKIKILTKKNGGTASALNAGIKIMHGEWFKWLSHDDVLYPNAIEVLIAEATKLENKKNWIIVSNFHKIDSKGKILSEIIEPNINQEDEFSFNMNLFQGNIGEVNTCLIHKSALEEFGLPDEKVDVIPFYELELRYCILNKVKLHFVQKTLLKKRIHEERLAAKTRKRRRLSTDKVRLGILEKMDPTEQKKYVMVIKNINEKKKLKYKIENRIDLILWKYLSPQNVKKIGKVYRKITRKKTLKEKLVKK